MSLSHEFLALPPDQVKHLISFSSLYESGIRFDRFHAPFWSDSDQRLEIGKERNSLTTYYKEHRKQCVTIPDALILPVIPTFEHIPTLAEGLIPYRVLNYYGFTVIPNEEVSELVGILKCFSENKSYNRLLEMCKDSMALEQHSLHCRI